MATLPQALAVSATRAATSGAVAAPAITSTSFIAVAGLKKCIPTKRSGCASPRASLSTSRGSGPETMTAANLPKGGIPVIRRLSISA